MKTTYNGVTKEISNRLFDPIKVTVTPPRATDKFGALSLYYKGRYYFPDDIKPTKNQSRINEGLLFEIQVVYYTHKWYQDTHYISEQFKEFLLNSKQSKYKN